MIGIPLGLLYANAAEWLIHKHVLHGAGKKKGHFFSFHWGDHHKAVRQKEHIDPGYQRSVFGWHSQGKEALSIALLTSTHLPLFPVAPFFVGTLVYSAFRYHYVHRRSHLDAEWARAHLPWHYDHHMGPNQDANWCVSRPWFDHLMGTREPYVGTEREAKDRVRRAAAKARRAARQASKQGAAAQGRAVAVAAVSAAQRMSGGAPIPAA